MEKHINIIALNIPFPANYGGVIDIYYKLYALSRCGFIQPQRQAAAPESMLQLLSYSFRGTS